MRSSLSLAPRPVRALDGPARSHTAAAGRSFSPCHDSTFCDKPDLFPPPALGLDAPLDQPDHGGFPTGSGQRSEESNRRVRRRLQNCRSLEAHSVICIAIGVVPGLDSTSPQMSKRAVVGQIFTGSRRGRSSRVSMALLLHRPPRHHAPTTDRRRSALSPCCRLTACSGLWRQFHVTIPCRPKARILFGHFVSCFIHHGALPRSSSA